MAKKTTKKPAAKKSTSARKSAGKPAPKRTTKKKAPAKKPATKKQGKLSQLDAAEQVLAKSGSPMNCQDMVTAMADQGLWKSPGGKTPHATLYSALLREITKKKSESRFKKVDRGQFTLA